MTNDANKGFQRLMRTPRHVDIDITNHCNLRCRYCYHFGGAGDVKKDLSAAQWLTFFYELGEAAIMDVTLMGGEPFIRNDLQEIIEGIVKNRMRFTILSNGTLISNEMAQAIAETGRCNQIQVSLDGSRPEIHDTCRGDGSFVKAVEGIQLLKQFNIPVTIRVTLHHYNIGDLDAIAYFILEELGIPSFSTNAADYYGLCITNSSFVQLTIEERCKAMKDLLRLKEEYCGRIHAQAGPLAEAEYFSQMQKAMEKGTKIEGGGALTSCGCPWQKISVRADGAIVPCTLLPHMVLGWINQDPLIHIWHNSPVLNAFRNRWTIPLQSFPFCNGCPYINQCSGGCPGSAYTKEGNEFHPNPEQCFRLFIKQGGKIPG